MDISKVRPDRVQEDKGADKLSGNKGAGKTSQAGGVKSKNDLADLLGVENTASSPSPEKVSWSADAHIATEGLAQAKAAPDVRQDKVAALKAAIQKGTYQVDSKAVAEKMLQSSMEEGLLTRKG